MGKNKKKLHDKPDNNDKAKKPPQKDISDPILDSFLSPSRAERDEDDDVEDAE